MVIDTTKEGCCRILANVLDQEMTATGMLIKKVRDIMNETSDDDQRTLERLLLIAFPRNDGQVVTIRRPGEMFLGLPKLLQLHRKLTLPDLVVREYFQVRSEADFLAGPDEPLGRIILVPSDGIAIIHRELVMKVVVTFTNGNECSDEMVTWCMFIVKG